MDTTNTKTNNCLAGPLAPPYSRMPKKSPHPRKPIWKDNKNGNKEKNKEEEIKAKEIKKEKIEEEKSKNDTAVTEEMETEPVAKQDAATRVSEAKDGAIPKVRPAPPRDATTPPLMR